MNTKKSTLRHIIVKNVERQRENLESSKRKMPQIVPRISVRLTDFSFETMEIDQNHNELPHRTCQDGHFKKERIDSKR